MRKVIVDKERPDFRVFIDLLYGANRNVDSDGDANPVYSRDWTNLYIKDRENSSSFVEIFADANDANVFVVESNLDEVEELAALYLYLMCGTTIIDNEVSLDVERIETLQRKYSTQLARAKISIWHRSSYDQPYPIIA